MTLAFNKEDLGLGFQKVLNIMIAYVVRHIHIDPIYIDTKKHVKAVIKV